jgi:hypothetical protein
MRIRLADGTERTLTRFIRDEWATTTPESDAASASVARLLRVLWRMGQVDEDEVFQIVSGKDRPAGATIVDKPDRGLQTRPD